MNALGITSSLLATYQTIPHLTLSVIALGFACGSGKQAAVDSCMEFCDNRRRYSGVASSITYCGQTKTWNTQSHVDAAT